MRSNKYFFRKCMHSVIWCFIFISLAIFYSCREYEFDNPVGSSVPLRPPAKLTVDAFTDTSVTFLLEDPNPVEPPAGTVKQLAVEVSRNGGNYLPAGRFTYSRNTGSLYGNFAMDTSHIFKAYTVYGENRSAEGTYSAPKLLTSAPSNVRFEFGGDTLARLKWNDNCSFESGYEIEQSTGNAGYSKAGTATRDDTSRDIAGAFLAGQKYNFRIRAVTPRHAGAYSQSADKQITFPAPGSVNATIISDSAVKVTWTDNSDIETGFGIEQSADNVNFVTAGTAAYNTTSKTVEGVYLVTTSYAFRVRAISKNNGSVVSAYQLKFFQFYPPSNLAVASITPSRVRLQWQDNSSIESGFEVYYSQDRVNYSLLSLQPMNTTSATIDATFTPGTNYSFKVRAKSKYNGYTEYSAVAEQIPIVCGISTVPYAGKEYNTVQIGTQCWLRENLDVGTRINAGQNHSDNSVIEKYCYDNNEVNCATYGGLYQWSEAMQYTVTAGAKGICPVGWHIPALTELQTLSAAVGGNSNALKALGQGSGSGQGTNTSGFSILLGGYRHNDGTFASFNVGSYQWSSTLQGGAAAYLMLLQSSTNTININNLNRTFGFSVRCLKD